MKKIFTSFLVAFCLLANAQTEYSFEMDTNPYQNLANSISVTNGLIWYEELQFSAPIEFDFILFGDTIDSIGTVPEYTTPIFLISSSPFTHSIIPFGTYLSDRAYRDFEGIDGGLSPISYITEGDEGNRIFKLEYNNIGFEDEIWTFDTSNDFVNFQLWLYEGSNIIEVHFGASSIVNYDVDFGGDEGPVIGLIKNHVVDDDFIHTAYFLNGDPTNPELYYATNDLDFTFMNNMPVENTVYRFIPENLGTENVAIASELQIFPNPATDFVTIKTNEPIDKVLIYAANGQLVKTLTDVQQPINVQSLAKGTYIFTIKTKNHSYNEKVLVK